MGLSEIKCRPSAGTAAMVHRMSKRVLVTGSAGGIGLAVCDELLRKGHRVRGFDLVSNPALADEVIADLVDRDAVRRACVDVDVVIHLAAQPDEADFLEELLEPNVRGLFHVCDSARAAGATRLVLASSMQTINGLRLDRQITLEDGMKPINHYAMTKVWAEVMGDMYARVYGMSVICARIGWLLRAPHIAAEMVAAPRGKDVFLSQRDAARFFALCGDAEQPAAGSAQSFFVTSRPHGAAVADITKTRELLG